jgi:hypothetical protein
VSSAVLPKDTNAKEGLLLVGLCCSPTCLPADVLQAAKCQLRTRDEGGAYCC